MQTETGRKFSAGYLTWRERHILQAGFYWAGTWTVPEDFLDPMYNYCENLLLLNSIPVVAEYEKNEHAK